jgi:hypothetical protein
MSFLPPPGSPIVIIAGYLKYFLAIFSTYGSMVAENMTNVL